jgi:hypothetical protein
LDGKEIVKEKIISGKIKKEVFENQIIQKKDKELRSIFDLTGTY